MVTIAFIFGLFLNFVLVAAGSFRGKKNFFVMDCSMVLPPSAFLVCVDRVSSTHTGDIKIDPDQTPPGQLKLRLLNDDAVNRGSVCLDGSPPGKNADVTEDSALQVIGCFA